MHNNYANIKKLPAPHYLHYQEITCNLPAPHYPHFIVFNFLLLFFAVEDAGGHCLPCVTDIQDEAQVQAAVEKAVEQFGGIDILVNNAGLSAFNLTGTLNTPMKRRVLLTLLECYPEGFHHYKWLYMNVLKLNEHLIVSLCVYDT